MNSNIEEEKLVLDGYKFIKDNHPQNVKRGCVGLYVKESLASQRCSDLVNLPEFVVCEIQLSRKEYFFVEFIEVQARTKMNF